MVGRAVRPIVAMALVAGAVPLVAYAQAAPGVIEENVDLVTTVPGATGGHSVIEGDRLYVGAYGLGMRLFDISDPRDPQQTGEFIPGPQIGGRDVDPGLRADAVPDATVMTDFEGNPRHIVTLNGTGRTAGAQQTEFLDWTDPANPVELWNFEDRDNGESHNGDIVDARGWWIPSGLTDFRIYDLAPLVGETPAQPENLFRGNIGELWADSPHNPGGETDGGGTTSIHDIEIYADRPVKQPDGSFANRDIALVAEGGNYLQGDNSGSLYVVDITDPESPVALLRYQRPDGLGTPVRYVHEAQFLEGQSDIIVTTDEDLHNGCNNGGIVVHRVSDDLTEIEELSQWYIGLGSPAAVCSVHVMSTKDDFAFFGSYNAGLQVVDLTDPENPVRGGQHIAVGADSWGALVHPTAPGYLTYVGDLGGRGLDVFDFTPEQPAPNPDEPDDDPDEPGDGPGRPDDGPGERPDRPGERPDRP